MRDKAERRKNNYFKGKKKKKIYISIYKDGFYQKQDYQ